VRVIHFASDDREREREREIERESRAAFVKERERERKKRERENLFKGCAYSFSLLWAIAKRGRSVLSFFCYLKKKLFSVTNVIKLFFDATQ
jgi:hypothetical protein